MTEKEIHDIVDRQRKYFQTGATLSADMRIAGLRRLYTAVSQRETEIREALKKDLGKSGFESYMCETGMVLEEISYMLKHIRSFSREKRRRTPLAQFHSRSYQKPSPYGVTLIMSPWNYPFMLTLSPEALPLWCYTDHESLELSLYADSLAPGGRSGCGKHCRSKTQRLFPSYQRRDPGYSFPVL